LVNEIILYYDSRSKKKNIKKKKGVRKIVSRLR